MTTDREKEIVGLIEEGYARWKIAEILGMGETSVRSIIRYLCEKHNCGMYDLPEALRKEKEDG